MLPRKTAQENRSMPPGVIIPELAYVDVDEAADWICRAFGFSRRLRIGNHRFQLVYAGESIVVTGAPAGRAGSPCVTSHGLMIRVGDVDRHYEHAKTQGAKCLSAPETFPFGERQYSVEDPGGHRWTFTQSVADVNPEDWGGQIFDAG